MFADNDNTDCFLNVRLFIVQPPDVAASLAEL